MPPWDLLFAWLAWLAWGLALTGAAIILFAILVGVARGVRGWVKPKDHG